LLGTVKVQRKPNNLRIGKTAAAAVAAAVAVKKEQRLPCLRTRRPICQKICQNSLNTWGMVLNTVKILKPKKFRIILKVCLKDPL